MGEALREVKISAVYFSMKSSVFLLKNEQEPIRLSHAPVKFTGVYDIRLCLAIG
jgi:hypothetical protein